LSKAKQGEVRGLPGFGEKSEQDLIRILEQQHHKSRIPYSDALKAAKQLKRALEKVPGVSRVIFLGSLRRELGTVGDIDMGMVAKKLEPVKEKLKKLETVKKVLVAGDDVIRLVLKNGWQVDIRQALPEEWGSFVQHFTGSKEHNIKLRELALKKGLSLSEHGIKEKKIGKLKKFRSEKEFYRYLGFKPIPPSERVGGEELEKYLVKG
jgi:DNA polymerase (family 10)